MLTALVLALTLNQTSTERVSGFFIVERNCKPFGKVHDCGCEARVSPKYIVDDTQGHRKEILLDPTLVNSYGGPQSLVGEWVNVDCQREQEGKYLRMLKFNVVSAAILHMALNRHDTSVYAPIPDVAQKCILQKLGTKDSTTKAGLVVKPYLNVLCRTNDTLAITPDPASDYQAMMKSTYPGFDHYVKDMSYGKWSVAGSQTVGWINLPKNTSDYQTFQNIFGGLTLWDHTKLMPDIVAQLDPTVDFSKFAGINIFMNTSDGGNGTAYATYYFMNVDGMATWLPITEDNVGPRLNALTHEDGHNFGFDHSSGAYNTAYDSIWDTMSGGYHNVVDPDLGTVLIGNGYNAFHRYKNNWVTKDRVVFALPGSVHTFHLEQLTDPTNSTDPLMAKIYIGGSARHYLTVESRKPVGYDISLPSCVVLHDVVENRWVLDNTSSSPRYDRAAQVVDPDNNGDPNDASAQWTPGETYTDAAHGISVEILSEDATGFNVRVTVDASQPMPGVITNGNDDGPGSFRDWIYYSQDVATPPTFHIPTSDPSYDPVKGFFRIKLLTTLPDIFTNGIVIDGASQTAFTGNTNPNGPEIMIDGSQAGDNVCGITFRGSNQTVKNIAIGNYSAAGILAYGSTNTTIQKCYVGIEADGVTPAPCKNEGIAGIYGVNGLVIGGKNLGNLVSGNTGNGIDVWDVTSSNTTIYGNFVGTDYSGTKAVPNGNSGIGAFRGTTFVTIGGTATGLGNLISGNLNGVNIQGVGVHDIDVEGNLIGLDVTGKLALGNQSSGMYVLDHAQKVTIRSNIVSGNSGNEGITLLPDGIGNILIEKNYIGTDISGKLPVPNAFSGIWMGANTTATVQNNVISGNGSNGIAMMGTVNSNVQGNFIGVDVTGEAPLTNTFAGIYIGQGTTSSRVGGAAGFENVLAGNTADGVVIADSTTIGNHISGNLIGVTKGGLTMGNKGNGLWIGNGANGNFIGDPNAPNVIVSSSFSGIAISGTGTSNQSVRNNYIGILKDGTSRGNVGDGIAIYGGATNNSVGGTAASEGNFISQNQNGVAVYDSGTTGNAIRGNSVFTNKGLGIQLVGNDSSFGVTLNDNQDTDSGPNNLQNFPVITKITRGGGNFVVEGTFNGVPNTTITVDFYALDTANPSGYGEGKTYLGNKSVTTDINGNATFSATVGTSASNLVSATATGADGSTSEFSAVASVSNGLDSLTISPAQVVAGTTAIGTVTLAGAAQAGGFVVNLASSNTSLATVPTSVTVPTGQTRATFTITTLPVNSEQDVTITASAGAISKPANLHLLPSGLVSLVFTPSQVLGGTSLTGKITTGAPATGGGLVVNVSVDKPAIATAPATVTIPAGSTSVTFTVTTVAVATDTLVTGTASAGTTTVQGTFMVQAPQPTSVSFSPANVAGGANSTGTVTLNGPAGTGGLVVTLNSDQAVATVPANVTVPAGATTKTFIVTTTAVGADVTANVHASGNSGSVSGPLTITAPRVSSLKLNPTSLLGGSNSTATVTLSSAAGPSGVVVSITSDNTSATVPVSVTVVAGTTTATFTVNTTPVLADATANLSATSSGAAANATLIIKAPTLTSLVLNPTSIQGGNNSTGTVTINGPAPTGMKISLSTDNANATVPGILTMAGGEKTATFTVTTTSVSATSTANVKATFGASNAVAPLSITAQTVTGIALSPTSVNGGTGSTGTVTISGFAPTGGMVVKLASDNSAATVPSNVTVPAGQTTVTFTITTTAVAADAIANISASSGTSSAKTPLTVKAPKANAISVLPTTVLGSQSAIGTVTLSGPAPAGGAIVTLASNKAFVTVPLTVTVLAGQITATFTATSLAVSTDQTAGLTATLNGITVSTNLGVTAPKLTALTINPTVVVGGQSSTVSVSINGPAPVGGLAISATCDNASVPPTVTIPAGATSTTFTITTTGASVDKTATVSILLNGATNTAPLTIRAIKITSVLVNPNSVLGGIQASATVNLNAASPPGGTTVALSLVSPVASCPASVTIPAGSSSALVTITTKAVTADQTASITATANGSTYTATFTVATTKIVQLGVNPNPINGGSSATGAITLNGKAPTGGLVITLTSDKPNLTFPKTVTVPAGSNTASFAAKSTTVAADTVVNVTGTGKATVTCSVTVLAPRVASIVLKPASVVGGQTSTATIALTGAAPAGGLKLTLTSTGVGVSVPATATVSAGSVTVTVQVKTTVVTTDTTASVSASVNGATSTTSLMVLAPAVTALTSTPTSGKGGTTFKVTVTIGVAAPASGINVTISSSNPALDGAIVQIPAAKTSTSVTLNSQPVGDDTTVTLSATTGTGSKTATIKVLAPVATFVVAPTTIKGGATATGTITLDSPAPSGYTWTIAAIKPLTAPATVTFTAGSKTATFTLTSVTVAKSTPVTVSVTRGTKVLTVKVTVNP